MSDLTSLLVKWSEIEPDRCTSLEEGKVFRALLPDRSVTEWNVDFPIGQDELLLEQAVKFAIRDRKLEIYSVELPVDGNYKYRATITVPDSKRGYSGGFKGRSVEALLGSYLEYLGDKDIKPIRSIRSIN